MTRARILFAGCVCMHVAVAISVAQQHVPLEERVRRLEQRIASLEARVGMEHVSEPEYDEPDEPAAMYQPYSEAPEASAAQSNYPLSVRLVSKTLQEKGPGEESDQLGFQFEFTNVGKDHLTSFEGEIELRNYTGEFLASFRFDIAEYLMVGRSTQWYSSIPFSAVNSTHRTMHTAPPEQLRLVLRLRQVMYYDTRVEKFY